MIASISANVIPTAAGAAVFSLFLVRTPRLIPAAVIFCVFSGSAVFIVYAVLLRGRRTLLNSLAARFSVFMFALFGFLLAGSRRFILDAWDSGAAAGVPARSVIGCLVDLIEDPMRLPGGRWVAEGLLVSCRSPDIQADSRGRVTVFGKDDPRGIAAGARVEFTGELSVGDSRERFFFADEGHLEAWRLPIFALRAALTDRLLSGLGRTSPDAAAFLSALVLGRKIDFDLPIFQDIAASGTMHLLALSGFHVGIFASLIRFLVQPAAGARIARGLSLLMVVLYLLLAGLRPSLVRASLMYGLWVFDRWRGRRVPALRCLALAFILHILLFPRQADELSFQLSYTALAGILVGGLSWSRLLARVFPRGLSAALCVGIGAQAAALPMVVRVFGSWQPAALPASLLLTPLITLAMIGGVFLSILPGGILFTLAAAVTERIIALIGILAGFFAGAPGLAPSPGFSWPAAFLGTIMPCILERRLRNGTPVRHQPRLPVLNPAVSADTRACAAQAVGTELHDQPRPQAANHRSSRHAERRRRLGNRPRTGRREPRAPGRRSGFNGIRD